LFFRPPFLKFQETPFETIFLGEPGLQLLRTFPERSSFLLGHNYNPSKRTCSQRGCDAKAPVFYPLLGGLLPSSHLYDTERDVFLLLFFETPDVPPPRAIDLRYLSPDSISLLSRLHPNPPPNLALIVRPVSFTQDPFPSRGPLFRVFRSFVPLQPHFFIMHESGSSLVFPTTYVPPAP